MQIFLHIQNKPLGPITSTKDIRHHCRTLKVPKARVNQLVRFYTDYSKDRLKRSKEAELESLGGKDFTRLAAKIRKLWRNYHSTIVGTKYFERMDYLMREFRRSQAEGYPCAKICEELERLFEKISASTP